MTDVIERWLPVVGFEGLYEVSDHGRVRSIDRIVRYERIDQYSGRTITVDRFLRGLPLSPGRKPSGHVSVAIRKGNSMDVHVLVLTAFVGPCPAGHEGLHDDDMPANNALSNLRWGTRGENLLDAVRNGKRPIGENAWNAKLKDRDIPAIRARLGDESMASIARDFGVSQSSIRQIRDRTAWGHIT